MKAITIKQPWASLISSSLKDVENRTWKTNFRGRVLIHAGKTREKGFGIPQKLFADDKVHSILNSKELPQGAIIGSVEIVDCVKNHPSLWAVEGEWNWVLANPILFDKPIEGVKGKLSFWEYEDELPNSNPKIQTAAKVPTPRYDLEELKERYFRKSISESTKAMMERLTLDEQMRVSFVPLIITQLAWRYADKAMECAARDKVSILKKLSRTLKMVRQKYDDELRRELDCVHFCKIIEQTEMCISKISHDLAILYFSANQEFKRSTPEYPYDELRTYAIMSSLFIKLLESYNKEMDKLLSERLRDRHILPNVTPPLIQHLNTGMVAFAGVEGKFNFNDLNVTNAMKVIRNRINSIEFSVF